MNGLDHWISYPGKKFGNQMWFGYQTFYPLNSKQLVCYSRCALNNRPFDQWTVLDHLNTELVCYSDPHCTRLRSVEFEWSHVQSDNMNIWMSDHLVGFLSGITYGVDRPSFHRWYNYRVILCYCWNLGTELYFILFGSEDFFLIRIMTLFLCLKWRLKYL